MDRGRQSVAHGRQCPCDCFLCQARAATQRNEIDFAARVGDRESGIHRLNESGRRNRVAEVPAPYLCHGGNVRHVGEINLRFHYVGERRSRALQRGNELPADDVIHFELDAVAFPQVAFRHLGFRCDAAKIARLVRRKKTGDEDEVTRNDDRHESGSRRDFKSCRENRFDVAVEGGNDVHRHTRLRQRQSREKHRRARRNVISAIVAARLVQERHGAPVGEILICPDHARKVGAARAQHFVSAPVHERSFAIPARIARQRSPFAEHFGRDTVLEIGRKDAGGEDPGSGAHPSREWDTADA